MMTRKPRKENAMTRSMIVTREEIVNSRSSSLVRPQTRIIIRPTSDIKHPIIPSSSEINNKTTTKGKLTKEINKMNLRRTNSMNLASTIKEDRNNNQKNIAQEKTSKNNKILYSSFDRLVIDDTSNIIHGISFRRRPRTAVKKPDCLKPPSQPPAGWKDFHSKLSTCPQCKRAFFPYRIKSHTRICNEIREQFQDKLQEQSDQYHLQEKQPPVKEHSPESQESKTESKTKKLLSKIQRNKKSRSTPTTPNPSKPSGESTAAKEDAKEDETPDFLEREYREAMKKMKRCIKCNRTFFPERIAVHEASCLSIPVKPFFLM